MAIKTLISGEAGAGKTTLIKDLKDALLLSHDGKRPNVKIPNVYVTTFSSVVELIGVLNEKIEAYNTKYGDYPKVIVIDSISRVYETIYNNCSAKFSGFAIYSNMDSEIKLLNDYIENTLIASGMDVVVISHALYDPETQQYNLVGKGSFSKLGGYYAVVDEGLFCERKSNKRVVHYRSNKLPARTLISSFPDSVDVNDFNMETYIETLRESQSTADSFAL
jgi:hypothetical protein